MAAQYSDEGWQDAYRLMGCEIPYESEDAAEPHSAEYDDPESAQPFDDSAVVADYAGAQTLEPAGDMRAAGQELIVLGSIDIIGMGGFGGPAMPF